MSMKHRLFIVILTLSVFLIMYFSRQNEVLRNFTHSADSAKVQLSQYVYLSSGFVDQMALVGDEYFTNGVLHPSPWRSLLKQSPSGDLYTLDALGSMDLIKDAGNLTGLGQMDRSADLIENHGLALAYNPHFKSLYDTLPGIAWIYYTGAEGFINIYPWVPSSEYHFTSSDFQRPFYHLGTPLMNPNRMRYWTPVYLDSAGKGLMVTVSKPVYDADTFRGVVSLDFTLTTLSSLMDPSYRSFVMNDEGQVLAGTHESVRKAKDILTVKEYLGSQAAKDLDLIIYSRKDLLSSSGGYYVFSTVIDNSSWTLVSLLPQWRVLIESFLFGSPVLLIGVLLYISSNANAHQKKTERSLNQAFLDLQESRAQLETAASIDFLTGALNRRSMTLRLHEELSRHDRYGTRFSLIMGDLDHFKGFNDQYGHAAGDCALKQVVQTMGAHIRSADLLSRWGGEEFLLMLPDTPATEAAAAAEKLRQAIEAMTIDWEHHPGLKITMTFGVSEYNPEVGLDRTIIQADDALYRAKSGGRNRVCIFEYPIEHSAK